jgi:drug/metabolite transporter (DMT)-like permease
MIFLLFSIISSTVVVVIFKYFESFKINNLNAIIINYLTASILGYILNKPDFSFHSLILAEWMPAAIIIGISFIVVLNIIGITAQKIGVTITTISGRMAVIIPITFSIIYYNEVVGIWKILGISLALPALILTMFQKDSLPKKYFILPVLLFLGMGIVDSIIKFTQAEFLNKENLLIFTTFLFSISAITGIIFRIFKQSDINFLSIKLWAGGILLGSANLGSLYFFIQALSHSNLDSSLVFGINHIGIVSLSVFAGLVLFREKLKKINWIGILLSLITIIILTRD